MTIEIGKKYNSLTVLKYSHNDPCGHRIWECQCDCGKTVYQPSRQLGKTKSCGCLRKEIGNQKGVGEIYGSLICRMKLAAKRRKIAFKVDAQYLWDLFLLQGRKCAISGIELDFGKGKNGMFRSASLDRIDSKLPYIKGNVQWVDRRINVMKQELSNEEFVSLVRKIYKFCPECESQHDTLSRY